MFLFNTSEEVFTTILTTSLFSFEVIFSLINNFTRYDLLYSILF